MEGEIDSNPQLPAVFLVLNSDPLPTARFIAAAASRRSAKLTRNLEIWTLQAQIRHRCDENQARVYHYTHYWLHPTMMPWSSPASPSFLHRSGTVQYSPGQLMRCFEKLSRGPPEGHCFQPEGRYKLSKPLAL